MGIIPDIQSLTKNLVDGCDIVIPNPKTCIVAGDKKKQQGHANGIGGGIDIPCAHAGNGYVALGLDTTFVINLTDFR